MVKTFSSNMSYKDVAILLFSIAYDGSRNQKLLVRILFQKVIFDAFKRTKSHFSYFLLKFWILKLISFFKKLAIANRNSIFLFSVWGNLVTKYNNNLTNICKIYVDFDLTLPHPPVFCIENTFNSCYFYVIFVNTVYYLHTSVYEYYEWFRNKQ